MPPPDLLYSEQGRQDPYPIYEGLRKNSPVHCLAGKGVWTVGNCDHVEEVLSRPDLYRSSELHNVEQSLQGADDPDHAHVRKIVSRALNAKQVAALESPIQDLTCRFVDEMIQRGTCDFVAELATPLPLQVIAIVLNFDPNRWEDYSRWTEAAVADEFAGLSEETRTRFEFDTEELNGFLEEHLRRCRAGDVGGVLATEVISDLTDQEALDILLILLIAGNVTTKHLLGNIAVALVQHPELFPMLADDPTLIPAMVEETLRINSPTLSIARRPARDVELGGETIPANSPLFILLGSANHSEERFPDATQFDLSRTERHLGFGHGIHFCVGAALSRLEARVLLETLVERRVAIEPVYPIEDIEWDPHTHLRGPKRLDVHLRSGQQKSRK